MNDVPLPVFLRLIAQWRDAVAFQSTLREIRNLPEVTR
jgi:hypothetical protein